MYVVLVVLLDLLLALFDKVAHSLALFVLPLLLPLKPFFQLFLLLYLQLFLRELLSGLLLLYLHSEFILLFDFSFCKNLFLLPYLLVVFGVYLLNALLALSLLLSNFIRVLLLQHLRAFSSVSEVLFLHVSGLVLVAHRGQLSGNLLLVAVEVLLGIALNVAWIRDCGRWVVLKHSSDCTSGRSSVCLNIGWIRDLLWLLRSTRDVARIVLLILLWNYLLYASLRRCVLLHEIIKFV